MRSLTEALRIIATACHGNLPNNLSRKIGLSEPLEIGRSVGSDPDDSYRHDEAFVNSWREAMTALAADANAPLPEECAKI